jgi:hypothetical protein
VIELSREGERRGPLLPTPCLIPTSTHLGFFVWLACPNSTRRTAVYGPVRTVVSQGQRATAYLCQLLTDANPCIHAGSSASVQLRTSQEAHSVSFAGLRSRSSPIQSQTDRSVWYCRCPTRLDPLLVAQRVFCRNRGRARGKKRHRMLWNTWQKSEKMLMRNRTNNQRTNPDFSLRMRIGLSMLIRELL